MPDKKANLTDGRRLARNVLWNLLGTGLPLLVAIFAIPVLVDELGIARFGVLTLAWMVVGYFSLFDLGLGRALTKIVSEKLGKGEISEIPALFWTAMSLMAMLGVLAAFVVAAISPWLVSDVLRIPLNLQPETLVAFYLLAISIPIVIGTTGLRGTLEAHQRFGLINAVQIPLGILTFLGPVAVLLFSTSLIPVVAVLVIARLVSLCVYAVICLRVQPSLFHVVSVRRAMVGPLVRFGGWMTISNLVGPLMAYFDRFLVSAIVSVTAVAYYATPYDMITRLWIIPIALLRVLFPAFSSAQASEPSSSTLLFRRAVGYLFCVLFPLVLCIVALSEEGMTLWLGEEFAVQSSSVLQILAVGVLINSLAYVPNGLIQGFGRPDLVAKLLLVELPFYLFGLWALVSSFGIVGAAIAWTVRIAVDTVALFVMTPRVLPGAVVITWRVVAIGAYAALAMFASIFIESMMMKMMWLTVALIIFAYIALAWIIEPVDRAALRHLFSKSYS